MASGAASSNAASHAAMLAPREAEPVDLIILSGFLGSGKTTLLLQYLNDAGTADTGVIVNEVGEIGVDGVIVADGSDAVPMTLLANGCVCCAMRSSLVDTVVALLDARRPAGYGPAGGAALGPGPASGQTLGQTLGPLRRIILETSGVSRPGPIIAALADPELAQRRLRLTVISTYDCVTGALQAERFDEASAQLAAAQRIVLTKLDLAGEQDIAHHRAVIAGINPLADIVHEPAREQAARRAFEGSASAVASVTAPDIAPDIAPDAAPDTAPDVAQAAGDAGVAQAVAALRASGRAGQAGAFSSSATPGKGAATQAKAAQAGSIAHPRIHVLTAALAEGAAWEDLALWLDDLSAYCGERLLRVKAVLRVSDCDDPILIQSVGTTFSAPRRLRAGDVTDNLFVIITRDLDAQALNTMVVHAAVTVHASRPSGTGSLRVTSNSGEVALHPQ
ncbi:MULTISPECIES: CobW family GTP-binding protein [unclassified Achromobacter]|uniref:CobW family GTP-binding protein n=1 Tax=unclassified Achromobacter TaxID=2626865 RepID=UPI001E45E5F4|nr:MULTISPECIES: CobW family GTP-binding protein [unclassified Achromobacter]